MYGLLANTATAVLRAVRRYLTNLAAYLGTVLVYLLTI